MRTLPNISNELSQLDEEISTQLLPLITEVYAILPSKGNYWHFQQNYVDLVFQSLQRTQIKNMYETRVSKPIRNRHTKN